MELNFQSFQPDEDVPKIAEAWSLDAVDYARKTFKITLDWSDHSIQQVEGLSLQKKLNSALKRRNHGGSCVRRRRY